MENEDKATMIRQWIDSEERITVDFEDEKDLNVVVTECTTETVALSLETSFPYVRQDITIPLADAEIGEDRAKYTRDPDRPLRHSRLRLTIRQKRPHMI
jgi:hypothetical protein